MNLEAVAWPFEGYAVRHSGDMLVVLVGQALDRRGVCKTYLNSPSDTRAVGVAGIQDQPSKNMSVAWHEDCHLLTLKP